MPRMARFRPHLLRSHASPHVKGAILLGVTLWCAWQEVAFTGTGGICVGLWHGVIAPGSRMKQVRAVTGAQNWWCNNPDDVDCITSRVQDVFSSSMQTTSMAVLISQRT